MRPTEVAQIASLLECDLDLRVLVAVPDVVIVAPIPQLLVARILVPRLVYVAGKLLFVHHFQS